MGDTDRQHEHLAHASPSPSPSSAQAGAASAPWSIEIHPQGEGSAPSREIADTDAAMLARVSELKALGNTVKALAGGEERSFATLHALKALGVETA